MLQPLTATTVLKPRGALVDHSARERETEQELEGTTMQTVKGMVQVFGTTYRVVRMTPGSYEVVRILDDERVGSFRLGPPMELRAQGIEMDLLRKIAKAAVQQAKTTWIGPLGPLVIT